MFYKTVLVASLLNFSTFPSSLIEAALEVVKYEFLQAVINKTNPAVVVHAFYGDATSEEWSGEVSKLCIPVYSVNLRRKNNLFRDHTFIKDTSITLSDNILYLVPIQDLTSFKQVVEDVRRLVFWRTRHQVVVITNASTEIVTEFFRYCFKHWIINVELVLNHDLTRTYTYNPFESLYLIQSDISSMFPDKIRNLHRFRLNISMFYECPTAMRAKHGYKGFDAWVSRTVMGAVNATFRYLEPPEGDVFGTYNQTSIDGVLRQVNSHATQVGFNSRFFTEDLLRVVDVTYVHVRNDVMVLVPIENAKLKNIFSATSRWTWIFLFGLTTVLFIYLYIFHKSLNFGAATTLIFLVITSKSVRELKGAYFRIVFVAAMLLIFYLQAAFNSRLTSVLTVSNPPKTPRNLHEVWETLPYKIRSRPSYKKFITNNLSPRLKRRVLRRLESLERDEQIPEMMQCKKQILVAKRSIVKFALISNLVRNRTICYKPIREVLMPSLQVYVLQHGSPFKKRFDWILSRLRDSGMLYWKRMMKLTFYKRKGDAPQRLTLRALFAAFIVLGTGLILATCVFLYEYYWSGKKYHRN